MTSPRPEPAVAPDPGLGAGPYWGLFQAMLNGMAYCRMLYEGGRPVDWIYLDVNPAFERLTGLRDILGKRVTEVIPGIREADSSLFEIYGRVACGGAPERFEIHLQALDAWFDVSVYSPAPEEFVAVFDVITERKRGETDLRNSSAMLMETQRAARAGSWSWDIPTGRLAWTEGLCHLFGLDPATEPSFEAWRRAVHPDDLAAAEARIAQALETHTRLESEYRVLLPDRRTRWISAPGQAEYGPDGKPLRMLGLCLDITERKEAEALLARELSAMERLQTLAQRSTSTADLESILAEVVDAAMAIGGADFGNIQLLDPASGDLRIVAQQGFPSWWIAYWDRVGEGTGACGTALHQGQRIVVEDVEQSPIFVGTPALEIQRRAGVRAVQSTPLVSHAGRTVGMFSTHYRKPGAPDARALSLLDLLARQAADLIEHKLDAARLQASEERLRLAMQATEQGWFDLDLKTGQVAVSREFARIAGDRSSGAPMTYQSWVDSIHREDLPGVLQCFGDCLASGETRKMEYRMRTRSGEWKWILSAARVVDRDAAGSPVRMTGTHADISERKAAEQALRESEARFRLLAENATDMISLHAPDGTYHYASPACRRLTGYEPEELVGRSAYAFIVAEDHLGVRTSHTAILDGVPVTTIQYRLRRKDGDLIWVETTSRTIHDPGSGDVVEIQAATRDITDRMAAERRQQETEAALQHLQRMESIGRLAGGVAHDINNVLAAIMAVANLQQLAGGDTGHQADLILQACLRGRSLVKGLTDFARKEVQETQVLDLNDLVRQEAELLRSSTLKQVDIRLDLDPDLPRLAGSPTALSNALMNLCVNALDAMSGGGTLTLGTARLDDRHLELSVRDTGVGMPAKVLERATEPFFTTKPFGKGTGLGLSVVFGTVQAHGGTLHLESCPGMGTVVRLRLPAVGDARTAHAPAPLPAEPRGQVRQVLVVDDDVLVRQTTLALLESQGHQVSAVSSGAEAMDLLAQGADIEALILDQAMPGMTGLDVLRGLRGMGLEVPVLLATGFADADLQAQLGGGSRVALLPKPFTSQELQVALEALF